MQMSGTVLGSLVCYENHFLPKQIKHTKTSSILVMQSRIYIKKSIEKAYVPCEDNRKKPDRGSPHVQEHPCKLKVFFISSQ